MKRSNPVMVYKDKENYLHCRIGIIGTNDICSDICHSLIRRHQHICCVFGGDNDNLLHTEGFHFNNTEHIIMLSTNICMLCDECVDEISRCRHNIKQYIDAFVDKIDKVEER